MKIAEWKVETITFEINFIGTKFKPVLKKKMISINLSSLSQVISIE